jgi:hypothetical protein
MRINLRIMRQKEDVRNFMQHLNKLFAEEYLITEEKAWKYFANSEKEAREPVIEYLQSQGWGISGYELPKIGGGGPPMAMTDVGSASYGYVINDNCEKLITWLLTNT